jgi:hypothetical protein
MSVDDVYTRQLPWQGTPHPLGRHVAHDVRSRAFPAFDAAPTPLRQVIHGHHGQVLNQGNVGSCTGNAGAGVLNSDPLHRPGEAVCVEADAVAFYSAATQLDAFPGTYPPDDTGSTGLDVAKVLKNRGLISRYGWAFGIDQVLAALTRAPLSIGVGWTNDMFTPDDEGFITATGDVAGGHQFVLRGLDPDGEWVLMLNSWGRSWGGWVQAGHRQFPGHARIRFSDLGALLRDDGDAVVLFRDGAH